MAQNERIEAIAEIDKNKKVVPTAIEETEALTRQEPNKERFDAYLGVAGTKNDQSKVQEVQDQTAKVTLLDEVKNINTSVDRLSKVEPKQLIDTSNKLIAQVENVKTKLQEPTLDLKSSEQTILNNKLIHIDENLRVALSKAGVEYQPSPTFADKRVNPIDRFLGFLTNGQQQLASMSTEIEQWHLSGKDISPANMLRIQMKLGYVTQEIEFFTAVLNKSLESTKTIMNVQV